MCQVSHEKYAHCRPPGTGEQFLFFVPTPHQCKESRSAIYKTHQVQESTTQLAWRPLAVR